jgi:hypothetical protein
MVQLSSLIKQKQSDTGKNMEVEFFWKDCSSNQRSSLNSVLPEGTEQTSLCQTDKTTLMEDYGKALGVGRSEYDGIVAEHFNYDEGFRSLRQLKSTLRQTESVDKSTKDLPSGHQIN